MILLGSAEAMRRRDFIKMDSGWDGRLAARRAQQAEAGLATMKRSRRKFLRLAAGAAALPALSWLARAQAYPTRPMTMVVPYSAGGPTDTIARIMAERMRTSLGQIILVENTTGAAGTIGVGRVARAAPDGYTISIGHWGARTWSMARSTSCRTTCLTT